MFGGTICLSNKIVIDCLDQITAWTDLHFEVKYLEPFITNISLRLMDI